MINAEEIKKINRLRDSAREEYQAQDPDEDVQTVQPEVLAQNFPPIGKGEELNIADVLVTCNFLFRDA
jgi:ATP-dependent DNA helicase 2 subunit 1